MVWLFVLSAIAGAVRAQDAPPIRLNTLGYLPGAAKQATIAVPCSAFSVVRLADGKRVLEGSATGPLHNADTDEQLFTADFSQLKEPGEYQLDVAGVGQSAPFRVAADLYREPFYLVTRAMYLARCGCAVHGEHHGQSFDHAACHRADALLDFIDERAGRPSAPAEAHDHGVSANSNLGPNNSTAPGPAQSANSPTQKDGTKGWHDAGDYNKYVVNAGITVGCMFRAWEDFRPQVEAIALGNQVPSGGPQATQTQGATQSDAGDSKDSSRGTSASGAPLPDFLAELKWEIDWLLTMQAPDGSVYHKVSTINFGPFIMPEDETDSRYFAPWSSAATADFVAMTAAAARHFRPYDPAYADRCLAAAQKSFAFLQAHPEDHQSDQSQFHTGGYGAPDWDDRLWAAAELWEATGDPAPLADFEARARSAVPQPWPWSRTRKSDDEANPPATHQWQVAADWDWYNVKNLGLLTYLSSQRPGRDPELVERIRGSLVDTADQIVQSRDHHGYARPLGTRYYWGCNGSVARQVLVLEAARRITHDAKYRATALDALNHLFGRNVYGRSFVTGSGDRPPLHPHDRRSGADKNTEPWPGYLVGGPHPGAKDWHDEEEDFRTNEIAINWNAALIYALAAALDDDGTIASDPKQ